MKLKSTFLFLGLILFKLAFSQDVREYYFSFPVSSKDQLKTITREISIDNFRNDTVWAYANEEQFVRFLKSGYEITLLPAPGYAPDVFMNSNPVLAPTTTWNFYPTYTAYESYMAQFEANYPAICKLSTIATLTSGRKLLVVKISDNVASDETEPEFLYTSSIHGDETTGYILMMHLIDYLLSNYGVNAEVTDLVNNMEIYINPLSNPDGTYAGGNTSVSGATRGNANGVDLNRNYPDPQDGQHPDGNPWQQETIAFMDFATQRDFVASANFHGGAEVVNYPWDTWATLHADDNWWQYVSREYADTVHIHAPSGYMNFLNNGVTNGYAWYEVAGGRQDYMNYIHHCREITIEISDTKLLPASQLEAHWEYNWRSLILYMKEARYGVHGIITDQVTGLPLVAKVMINGHDIDNSEVYSNATGDYHRPIKAGTYTLEISSNCYQTQNIPVTVSDHATYTLNVQLVPVASATLTTVAAASITYNTAVSGGNITCQGTGSITAKGVCWSTAVNPTVADAHTNDGAGSGAFVSNITGLLPSTLYHCRAYAINAGGTFYGNEITFTTSNGIPVITTSATGSITSTTASSGGNVTSQGMSAVTARGVCWSATANPVATGLHTNDGSGTGVFTSFITGLSPNTTYHVRAYATNSYGTAYGADIQFTTLCGVTILPLSEVFGGTAIPACWSTQYSGTGATDKWAVSTTINAGGSPNEMKCTWQNINPGVNRLVTIPFNTQGMSSLNLSFRHMLDAYGTGCTLRVQSSADGINWTNESWSVATTATNIVATTVSTFIQNNLNSPNTRLAFTIEGNLYQYDYWYIDNVSVSAVLTLANVLTLSPSAVTAASASSGGNITTAGGSLITARGVCWGTSIDPVVGGNHTTDGTGTGSYVSEITGLSPNTFYYVRAYATNSTGTAYGANYSFTTCSEISPVSVSIAGNNPVCAGSSVLFTATPVNGGSSPVYQWKLNGSNVGINTSTYSYSPANGDILSCVLTSNQACVSGNPASSAPVNLVVNPVLPLSVNIQASANPVVAGNNVDFTAQVSNGGSLPVYQWKVNGTNTGSGLALFNYSPANNDVVTCEVTSNAVCVSPAIATSNSVLMTVVPLQLEVTPSIQNVGSVGGITNFSVTSNSSWEVTCDQPWCNFTPSGSGNGNIAVTYNENSSPAVRIAYLTIYVTGLSPVIVEIQQEGSTARVLQLSLFLEGLFNGVNMNKARNSGNEQFSGDIADQIQIELHSSVTPYTMEGSQFTADLSVNGNAEIIIPAELNGSYYLVIKHRNSMETWSATPVSFASGNVSYDFSDMATKAYGNNLNYKQGKYLIYTGDVNQDDTIDVNDILDIENAASIFLTGYYSTDVNGDGLIDSADEIITDNNASQSIELVKP
jgi:hypothetical protein